MAEPETLFELRAASQEESRDFSDSSAQEKPNDVESTFLLDVLFACSLGIPGTAVRYALETAATSSGFEALPSLAALMIGCFVMGWLHVSGKTL